MEVNRIRRLFKQFWAISIDPFFMKCQHSVNSSSCDQIRIKVKQKKMEMHVFLWTATIHYKLFKNVTPVDKAVFVLASVGSDCSKPD